MAGKQVSVLLPGLKPIKLISLLGQIGKLRQWAGEILGSASNKGALTEDFKVCPPGFLGSHRAPLVLIFESEGLGA